MNEGVKKGFLELFSELEALKILSQLQNTPIEEVEEKKRKIEDQAQLFSSPEFLIWKRQRQKYLRKKRWRKKKREIAAELRRKENDIKSRAIDEWIQRREDKATEELKKKPGESNRATKKKKLLIQKLKLIEQLRQRKKLKDPGLEATSLSEMIERAQKEKEATFAQRLEDTHQLESQENIEKFYTQGETSLEKLIRIRTKWDKYIVDPGKGSRIPQHFVDPPALPSKKWAKFLQSTTKK